MKLRVHKKFYDSWKRITRFKYHFQGRVKVLLSLTTSLLSTLAKSPSVLNYISLPFIHTLNLYQYLFFLIYDTMSWFATED